MGWVAPAANYVSSANVMVNMDRIDILARILSMGKMHHAFTGTGSIALTVAAALPGSIVARNLCKMSSERQPKVVRIGHAAGRLAIGATCVKAKAAGRWIRRSCRAVRVSWCRAGCMFDALWFEV